MPEPRLHIVSSAVVICRPGWTNAVAERLAALPDTEVRAAEANKIVVILEGTSRGAVGDRLTTIAVLDGVIAANLVFEHVEEIEHVREDEEAREVPA